MAKRVRLNGRTGPSPSSANAASPTSPAAANGKPRVVNFGPSISDDAAAADAGRLAPVSFTSQDEEPQKRKLGPGRGKVAARAEADRLQAGRRSLPIYEGRQELLAAIRQFPTVIGVFPLVSFPPYPLLLIPPPHSFRKSWARQAAERPRSCHSI